MNLPSLSKQLKGKTGFLTSSIDDKEFVPLDTLDSVINEQNVKVALELTAGGWAKLLGLGKPSDLPKRVTEQAKKIFGALVLMGKVLAIHGLINEGLADEHLPLVRCTETEAILSNTHEETKTFAFGGWSNESVSDFLDFKQWLLLAPVLDVNGQLRKVHPKCALPFIESEVIGGGAAGIVYRAKIHPAHQRGFESETVDLQVAVKEFLYMKDFMKENEILQQIKDLYHHHIIRHFTSVDKEKRGYIIFQLANGGNLQDFWEASKREPSDEASRERILWSLRQILGLTSALSMLHKRFNCRHGDLKPGNILCVTERGENVLKIADFGVSRIHPGQTISRKKATASVSLTPSYQGPEVEFERIDITDQRPRSRKYDIWSLGCVFLEFSIWLLHGPEAIKEFADTRGTGRSSNTPLYEVTSKNDKVAKVHQLAEWTIERLQDNPQCKEDTALGALLSLIKNKMLLTEVNDRPSAEDVCNELENIVKEAEKRLSYVLPSCHELCIPPIDFQKFQWSSI